MWPFDYFRKIYEIVTYAGSSGDALKMARSQLPFSRKSGSILYANIEERVEGMYSLETLDVSEFEAKITFTLTPAGQNLVKRDKLEDRLKVKKK